MCCFSLSCPEFSFSSSKRLCHLRASACTVIKASCWQKNTTPLHNSPCALVKWPSVRSDRCCIWDISPAGSQPCWAPLPFPVLPSAEQPRPSPRTSLSVSPSAALTSSLHLWESSVETQPHWDWQIKTHTRALLWSGDFRRRSVCWIHAEQNPPTPLAAGFWLLTCRQTCSWASRVLILLLSRSSLQRVCVG